MSDEKWEKMEDWEIKTYKRISELEKHDEQLREIVRKWNQEILDNRRHISELGKKVIIIDNRYISHGELDELKEEIKHFKEYEEMIQDIHDKDYFTIKEVLRSQYKFRIIWAEKAIFVDGAERLSSDQVVHLRDQIRFYGKLLAKLDGSGGEKDWFENGWCSPYWKAFKQHSKPPEYNPNCERCTSLLCEDCIEKPPEPTLEEKFIKTISNPKLHWYYKTPKGEGFLDEPREDNKYFERKCIGCSDNFRGGVHAFMCGPCAFNLLNDGIIVKREDLQLLIDYCDTFGCEWLDRIKEEYNIK